MSKKFEKNLIPYIKRKNLKKFFTGEVSPFILIPILLTYGFFRHLRIAFQTCTQIFLINTWQPWACVFKWACWFKEGKRSIYNNERLGAPITVNTNTNVNRLRALLTTDRCLTTRMLSVELGINREMVCQLLHNKLHMRKLYAKLVQMHQHTYLVVRKKYSHVATPTLQHDFAPCDFFLFTNSSWCWKAYDSMI